jgi:hypothetical protein
MITKLKIQFEEYKRVEEALKERLEEKYRIIGSLEAEIVTLRKYLQKKNLQNNSKVLDEIIRSQRKNHDSDTTRKKMDQDPKEHIKKHYQESMQRQ